jgi:DnaK suppressor protein
MIDTTKYRKRLEQRLAELGERLVHIKDELDDPLPKDWEDQATAEEDDEVLQSLGSAGQNEITMIRKALERIADGTYGTCARCGDAIAPERLDILPHTPLCTSCANATAHQNR